MTNIFNPGNLTRAERSQSALVDLTITLNPADNVAIARQALLPRTVLITLGSGDGGVDDLDDLERALTALRGVGTPARVAAATIEEVGGRTVGRARLLLPEGTDRRAAEDHLRGAGVTVEEVAR